MKGWKAGPRAAEAHTGRAGTGDVLSGRFPSRPSTQCCGYLSSRTLIPATLRDRGRCLSAGKGAESQGGDHSEQKG